MSIADAQAFAEDWIEGFNSKDLARILPHYTDDVKLISPIYLRWTDGRTDTVVGVDELERYFATALQRYTDLRFTLLEVAEGTRSLCIRYHTNLGGRIAMECFERNEAGKAERVTCHYVAP
jgi:ketosteroid isomerase-like protein